MSSDPRNLRLGRALDRAAARGHLLITAGPGFGKTELLRSWSAARPNRCLVTLTPSAGDPIVLLAALSAAIGPGQDPPVSIEDGIARLVALPNAQRIVCDQVETIRGTQAELLLQSLLLAESGPCFVLAGRTPFPIPVAELARGRVFELNADDLRFTPAEVKTLLLSAGAIDAPPDMRAVEEATGGWPMGVMLFRQSVYQEAALETADVRFRSHARRLDRYFELNVDCDLKDWRSLARRVAILDKLTPELIEFVLSVPSGRSVIEAFEYHGLLTREAGAVASWRFAHPLLRLYLGASEPLGPQQQALHDRAAQWWTTAKDPIRAIHHAVLAENWTQLGAIIEQAGGWRLAILWRNQSPQWSGLNAIFDLLPSEILRDSPVLQLTRLFLLSTTGELSDTLSAFGPLSETQPATVDPVFESELSLVGHCLRLLEDRVLDPTEYALLARASANVPHGDRMATAILENAMCAANVELGNLEAAIASAERAKRFYDQMHLPSSIALMDFLQGQALMLDGRYDEAIASYERGIRREADQHGNLSDAVMYGHAMLAELAIDRGEYQLAEKLLLGTFPAVENLGTACFPIASQARIRITARRQGLTSAYAHVFDSAKTAQRKRLPRVERLVMICWAEQMCCFGHYHAAAQLIERLKTGALATDIRDIHPRLALEHVEAWVRIATGRADQALAQLIAIRGAAETRYCARARIDWHILASLAEWEIGQHDRAMSDMLEAVRLAAPSMILRPFVDRRDGVTEILRALRQDRHRRAVDHGMDRFALSVLSSGYRAGNDLTGNGMEVMLGVREREIVELLGRKLSNKEIGRTLDISENTVKWHLKNLFGKFNTNDRETLFCNWQKFSKRMALPTLSIDLTVP